MAVQLPEGIPTWACEAVIGQIPAADPAAMRRCGDHLESAAAGLAELADALGEHTLGRLQDAIGGDAGAKAEELLRTVAGEMWTVSEGLGALAHKTYEAATALEFQVYLAIGVAIALAAQLTASLLMFPAGGPVLAITQKLAARNAAVLGWRTLLTRLAQILARFAVQFPRLTAAIGATALGMGIGGGVYWGAQRVQVAQGHRDGVDWSGVGTAVVSGGVGGVVGASVGRAAAVAVSRRTVGSASRAARIRGQVLATVAAGAGGGVSGGLAGGVAAWVVSGGELRRDDLINMAITGFGSGLVGAMGSALNSARAAAGPGAAGLGARVADIGSGPALGPPMIAESPVPQGQSRVITATGDGHTVPAKDLAFTDMARGQEVTQDLAGQITKIGRDAPIDPAEFAEGAPRRAAQAFVDNAGGPPRHHLPGHDGHAVPSPKEPGSQQASSGGNRGPGASAPPPVPGSPGPAAAGAAPELPPARISSSVSATDTPPPPLSTELPAARSTTGPEEAGGEPGRPAMSTVETPARPGQDSAPAGDPDGGHTSAADGAGEHTTVGDGRPHAGNSGNTNDFAAGPPLDSGDGTWNALPPDRYTSGQMNCAPEAVADTFQKTGYTGGDLSALGNRAATEGVYAASYAKALGGDLKPGGWDSPAVLIADVSASQVPRHVAGAIQMRYGAHAFTVTKTADGPTVIHERVGNLIRDISSEGWVRERISDDAGHEVELVTEDPNAIDTWLNQLPEVEITTGVEFENGKPVLELKGAEPGGAEGLRFRLDVPWSRLGNMPEGGAALLERDATGASGRDGARLDPVSAAEFADIARLYDQPSVSATPGSTPPGQAGPETGGPPTQVTVPPSDNAGSTATTGPPAASQAPTTPPPHPATHTAQPANQPAEPPTSLRSGNTAGPAATGTEPPAARAEIATPVPETEQAIPRPVGAPSEPAAAAGNVRPDAGSHPGPETAAATTHPAVGTGVTESIAPGTPAPTAEPITHGMSETSRSATREHNPATADGPAAHSGRPATTTDPQPSAPLGPAANAHGPDDHPGEPEEFRPQLPGPMVTMPRPSLAPDPGEHSTSYPMELPLEYERHPGGYIEIPGVPHIEEDTSNREPVLPRELTELRPNLPAERPRFQPHDPDGPPTQDTDPRTEPAATPWVAPPQRFTAAPPTHLPAVAPTTPDTAPLPGHFPKRPDEHTPGAPTDPTTRPGLDPHSLSYAPPLGAVPHHTSGPGTFPAPPPGKPVGAVRPVPWAQASTGNGDQPKRRKQPSAAGAPSGAPQPPIQQTGNNDGNPQGTSGRTVTGGPGTAHAPRPVEHPGRDKRGGPSGAPPASENPQNSYALPLPVATYSMQPGPAQQADIAAAAESVRAAVTGTPLEPQGPAAVEMVTALLSTAEPAAVVHTIRGGEGDARWVVVEVVDRSRVAPTRDQPDKSTGVTTPTESGQILDLLDEKSRTWGLEIHKNGDRVRRFTLGTPAVPDGPLHAVPDPEVDLSFTRSEVAPGGSTVRRTVVDLLRREQWDTARIESIRGAVQETFGNVATHASKGGARVRMWFPGPSNDELVVEVLDESRGAPGWKFAPDTTSDDPDAPVEQFATKPMDDYDPDASAEYFDSLDLAAILANESNGPELGDDRAEGTHGRGGLMIMESASSIAYEMAAYGAPGKMVVMRFPKDPPESPAQPPDKETARPRGGGTPQPPTDPLAFIPQTIDDNGTTPWSASRKGRKGHAIKPYLNDISLGFHHPEGGLEWNGGEPAPNPQDNASASTANPNQEDARTEIASVPLASTSAREDLSAQAPTNNRTELVQARQAVAAWFGLDPRIVSPETVLKAISPIQGMLRAMDEASWEPAASGVDHEALVRLIGRQAALDLRRRESGGWSAPLAITEQLKREQGQLYVELAESLGLRQVPDSPPEPRFTDLLYELRRLSEFAGPASAVTEFVADLSRFFELALDVVATRRPEWPAPAVRPERADLELARQAHSRLVQRSGRLPWGGPGPMWWETISEQKRDAILRVYPSDTTLRDDLAKQIVANPVDLSLSLWLHERETTPREELDHGQRQALDYTLSLWEGLRAAERRAPTGFEVILLSFDPDNLVSYVGLRPLVGDGDTWYVRVGPDDLASWVEILFEPGPGEGAMAMHPGRRTGKPQFDIPVGPRGVSGRRLSDAEKADDASYVADMLGVWMYRRSWGRIPQIEAVRAAVPVLVGRLFEQSRGQVRVAAAVSGRRGRRQLLVELIAPPDSQANLPDSRAESVADLIGYLRDVITDFGETRSEGAQAIWLQFSEEFTLPQPFPTE